MISDLNKALRKLREDGPPVAGCGICYNTTFILLREFGSKYSERHVAQKIAVLVNGWPEYSGVPDYPVPAYGNGAMLQVDNSPDTAYDTCSLPFSPEHEYGRARLRLLDYLIEVTDGQ